jgi:hypothetical protein
MPTLKTLHRRARLHDKLRRAMEKFEQRKRYRQLSYKIADTVTFDIVSVGSDFGFEGFPRNLVMVIIRSDFRTEGGIFHAYLPLSAAMVIKDGAEYKIPEELITSIKDRVKHIFANWLINQRQPKRMRYLRRTLKERG